MRHLILLRLKLLMHQLLPFFILLLLSFVEQFYFFRMLPVEPLFVLPLLYYWAIFNTEKLSAFSLFSLGLFDDGVSGAYLGKTSLVLLILYALVLTQRHHIKELNFKFVWGGFGIFMFAATLLEWGISSLLMSEWLSIFPLIGQNVLAITLYPWFNKVVRRLEK
jgi:rod shape-determining protein MreD